MDGTENLKDTSQTGDTSKGTKETSETTQTFTKETERTAISDALSRVGRTAADFEKREQAITAKEEADAQRDKAKYEASLEDARDDPEKTTAIKAKELLRTATSKLAEVTKERDLLSEKVTAAATQTQKIDRTKIAAEIAAKHSVDVDTLVKFTDGSLEAMEELAQTLKGESKPLLSDSGKTIGGVDWRGLSSDDKIRKGTK